MIAEHSLWICSLCCFLKAPNNMHSVRWQCTVSNLISNVCSRFFFLFFFIYCCLAVLLYEVLKWKIGLSCMNNLLLLSLSSSSSSSSRSGSSSGSRWRRRRPLKQHVLTSAGFFLCCIEVHSICFLFIYMVVCCMHMHCLVC